MPMDGCVSGSVAFIISQAVNGNTLSCGHGQGQILTTFKIKIPKQIEIEFGTVYYVHEIICPRTKFGVSCSRVASGGICEIYDRCYFLYFVM